MSFILIRENGKARFSERRFETKADACAAGKKTWSSWVLFMQEKDGALREMESGGLGWGHSSIRKHASATFLVGQPSALNEVSSRPDGAAPLHFVLMCEVGPGSFEESVYENEEEARAVAKRLWCSWVLYRSSASASGEVTAEGRTLDELSSGGVGFGQPSIRKHAASSSRLLLRGSSGGGGGGGGGGVDGAASVSSSIRDGVAPDVVTTEAASRLREKADAVTDESLAQPLRDAVERLERAAVAKVAATQADVQAPSAEVSDADVGEPLAGPLFVPPPVPPPAPLPATTPSAEDPQQPSAPPTPAGEPPARPVPAAPVTASASAPRAAAQSETNDAGGEVGAAPVDQPGDEADGKPRGEACDEEVIVLSKGEPLRRRLAAALAQSDETLSVSALVLLMQSCAERGGADELVATLVETLEQEPPTDAEMKKLRALQEVYVDGMQGYAAASAWLAALFVRTERCIRARSRLTNLVMQFTPAQRTTLSSSGALLLRTELPELLSMLSEMAGIVARLSKDIQLQETSVRVAKGVSAAMSVAGTVMVFTPLLPLGVGLLAGGAGVGVTTATGDAIGQHVQKEDLRKGLDRLSECENRCLLQLEALITACFPDVPSEDWAAARGAGVSFEGVPAESLHSMALMAGGTAARAGAAVASRMGLAISTIALSIVGSAVSTGDFLYSMLTSSPNRKSLGEVASFIEGKAEAYRVWCVLIRHWLDLNESQSNERPRHRRRRRQVRLMRGWLRQVQLRLGWLRQRAVRRPPHLQRRRRQRRPRRPRRRTSSRMAHRPPPLPFSSTRAVSVPPSWRRARPRTLALSASPSATSACLQRMRRRRPKRRCLKRRCLKPTALMGGRVVVRPEHLNRRRAEPTSSATVSILR